MAEAEAEGVKFRFLAAPAEISGSDGKAAELKVELAELGETDAKAAESPSEPGSTSP